MKLPRYVVQPQIPKSKLEFVESLDGGVSGFIHLMKDNERGEGRVKGGCTWDNYGPCLGPALHIQADFGDEVNV